MIGTHDSPGRPRSRQRKVLVVDDSCSLEEVVAKAESHSPTRLCVVLRRQVKENGAQLLRLSERALVDQYGTFITRAWAQALGTTSDAMLPFSCECAQDLCEEEVDLAVSDLPAPTDDVSSPFPAPGHYVGERGPWHGIGWAAPHVGQRRGHRHAGARRSIARTMALPSSPIPPRLRHHGRRTAPVRHRVHLAVRTVRSSSTRTCRAPPGTCSPTPSTPSLHRQAPRSQLRHV